MTRLENLFIEFGVSNKHDLMTVISNKIDWFNEKLMDDCWDTVATVYKDGYEKLLNELDGVPLANRTAYFRTVVCYYYAKDKYELFEGVCEGKITLTERGDKGFGYDAVFLPDGFENTFAELNREEKNRISHRAKAFEKLKAYLSEH